MPDLEQTLATMPLQTSLSSDNFKKFKPLLCPPVAELQRLSRNVIRCLPLSRLPSTLPVKDKNSKPLRLHTCPKNSICLFLIVFNSDLWTFPSLNTFTLVFFSAHEILNIRLINHISAASIFFSMSLVIVKNVLALNYASIVKAWYANNYIIVSYTCSLAKYFFFFQHPL